MGMATEMEKGFSKNWWQIIENGELTNQDLYDLANDVIETQNRENPLTEPPKLPKPKHITFHMADGSVDKPDEPTKYETLKDWDPTEVYLKWNQGLITLIRHAPTAAEPYEAINMDVSSGHGRRSHTEYIQIRKDPDGQVRTFWTDPQPLCSQLLDRQLGKDYMEVALDPGDRKKIAQALLFACARNDRI